jgi:uncharacterized protein YifE (UPF0438 family)
VAKIPADHLVYLERRPFIPGCYTSVFPADELKALEEFGNWMEALSSGAIKPVTKDQEHFLAVDREEAEPSTVAERAWVRLKGRREYEREQKEAAPPSVQENYGILEFDADRCWW